MELSELRKAVEEVELVDAHAHNIVSLNSNFPFIHAFSEASDQQAISFSPHSLSFKRSLREIAELYGSESSLEAVEEYRRVSGLQSIISRCFKAARISVILIDDGLELDKKQDLSWHRSFTPFVGRILRIERVAEKILDEDLPDGSSWTVDSFTQAFVSKLKSVAGDIFGLKSIAAYRSGLEINTNVTKNDAEEGLRQVLTAGKPVRIANKNLIDYIFLQSLEVAQAFDLPLQIHTGFGDKDLDMRFSNPLHLRAVLEDKRYSKSRIVLLHASYPFSREASYLASVYSQVYLDFGLAVPKLSVHGMISSVKELLELAPINKVMFSTDGYAFPETFYLGAKKSREVVFSVLRDACIDGDLSIPEAVEAAKDILARTAINFYKINSANGAIGSHNNLSQKLNVGLDTDVSFVRMLLVDCSGQHRCRAVPKKRFNDVVAKNGIGLAFAIMGTSSLIDAPADGSGLYAVGETRLIPDLSTKRRIPWNKQEEIVIADMCVKPGLAWDYCPREALRRVTKVLKDEFNLVMNAGFESEFYLLKSITREGKEEWVPFDSSPYSSSSAYDAASPILHEIAAALHSMGISVEQLHAEAGNGQFELVTEYTICTKAADNLIYTREVVRAIARKHGLLATFVPKYALDDLGSGSHVHLSLWQNGQNVFMASDGSSKHGISTIGEEFMAGILHHLPSILAFICPLPNSYDRLQPHTFSGAYLFWGNENKEAPLRASSPPGIPNGLVSNFEMKSFDGSANPYLGLAAIVAAGIDGLRRHLPLPEPVDTDPDTQDLQRLPTSLSESLEALHKDDFFKEFISDKLLTAIKAIRKAVPKKRFNDVVAKNGIGLAFAVMGMSSLIDAPADGSGLYAVGETRLIPDLSTKRRIPWNKQEEIVMADLCVKPGLAWDYCPREALRRVTKVLKDEFNLEMNAGFENEFYLLKSITREGKEEWVPFDSSPYSSSSAYDAASPILHEIAAALHSMGISVEQLHAEAGNGQFELVTGYTICTKAADNLIYTREVVRAIARKHGLLATFVPKYSLDDLGSGSHVHLSLWQNGQNVFMASDGSSKHGISTIGEEFMAGILHHLPSILAFICPLPNSYDRLQPHTWSGAYLFWGNENKEAPLRASSPPGIPNGLVSNFEMKSFDGSANPYLGLAAIVAAGIDGLRRHLPLPEPVDTDPDTQDLQRLPTSLSESLEALHKDDFFKEFISDKLLTAIKAIRKAEIDHYSKHKDAYKQLIHRY